MGFKEILSKLSRKGNVNRDAVNQMANQLRLEKIANERQLSSNERELLRLRNEDREEMIKDELQKQNGKYLRNQIFFPRRAI